MSNRNRTTRLLAAAAFALAAPTVSHAQTAAQTAAQAAARPAQTDPRWYPWLGCWQSDSTAGDQTATSPSTTCVVPIAGSTAVEALTILRGRVIVRDRLDASGKPHAISGQGCDGFETVNWSPTGHRVYRRSDYACGTTRGTSSTIDALSSSGQWVHVEEVRSGSGSIVSVDRRRTAEVPAEVPADAARALGRQRLAITTARADAAAPITSAEIIDAMRSVSAPVVRSWLVASEQRFNFDQQQLLSLAHADVPPSVLQAIMSAPGDNRQVLGMDANGHSTVYQSAPPYGGAQQVYTSALESQPMSTMYVCPPAGCYDGGGAFSSYSPYNAYSPYNGYAYPPPYGYAYPLTYSVPIIVNRGGHREPFREPVHPRQPVVRGPVGRRP